MLSAKHLARILTKPIYILALLIVVLAVLSFDRSPVFNICANPQTYAEHDKGGEKPQYAPNLTDYLDCATAAIDANHNLVIAIGAALTAIFTGTLWWVSSGQLKQLRRSVDVSKSALTDLERAYIYIDGIRSDLRSYLQPNTVWARSAQPSFDFSIINHGRTPGNIEAAVVCFQVLKQIPTATNLSEFVKATTVEDGPTTAEIIIGPGKSFKFPPVGVWPEFEVPQGRAIIEGITFLWCHGWFRYLDIFAKPHTVEFCRRYVPQFDEFVPEGGKERNNG